jgi:hypothetical protein
MEVIRAIKLDEAIEMLRKWISRHSAYSKQIYESIFRKLLQIKIEKPLENDLELIIWFYETHLPMFFNVVSKKTK